MINPSFSRPNTIQKILSKLMFASLLLHKNFAFKVSSYVYSVSCSSLHVSLLCLKPTQRRKTKIDISPNCRIFVVFPRRNFNLGNLSTFPLFLEVNKESLGALRCDLGGQNGGQILNLLKFLYKISLRKLTRWRFKIRWYSLE